MIRIYEYLKNDFMKKIKKLLDYSCSDSLEKLRFKTEMWMFNSF